MSPKENLQNEKPGIYQSSQQFDFRWLFLNLVLFGSAVWVLVFDWLASCLNQCKDFSWLSLTAVYLGFFVTLSVVYVVKEKQRKL